MPIKNYAYYRIFQQCKAQSNRQEIPWSPFLDKQLSAMPCGFINSDIVSKYLFAPIKSLF